MINKNIKNNQANCLQKLACLLFLFLLISCQEERGCIDADDFGEYETHTFSVESSLLDKFCTYNNQIERESPLQPCGIRKCLAQGGSPNYTYSPDICEDVCRNSSSQSDCVSISRTAEPLWVSVGSALDKITIDRNSKILITAQGNVMLGGSSEKQSVGISNTDIGKESLIQDSAKSNLIKVGNENLNVFFSNKFTEGAINNYFRLASDLINALPAPINLTPTTDNSDNIINNKLNIDPQIANGARKVFAYFLKYPTGISSDYKKVNVPIFPDPDAWKPCNGNSEERNLDCGGVCNNGTDSQCGDYYNILSASDKVQIAGVTPEQAKINAYNASLTNLFKIKNDKIENSRFEDGTGFIISNEDTNLVGTGNPDPALNAEKELPRVTESFIVTPTSDYIYKFSASSASHCTDNTIKLVETIVGGAQSEKNIVFGAEYELLNGKTYSLKNPTSADCGIKIKPYPFHEIKFQNSGYVSFGIPKQFFASDAPSTDSGVRNCRLKFKIINADGTEDFRNYGDYFGTIGTRGALTTTITPAPASIPDKFFVKATVDGAIDSANFSGNTISFSRLTLHIGQFYVFTKQAGTNYAVLPIAEDGLPLANIPSGLNVNTNIDTQFFVRKNQTIRFHPASWNGTWKSITVGSAGAINSLDVACGKGFYIKQIPRPAVFCTNIDVQEYRDVNEDVDTANDCKNGFVMDSSGKKRIGCDISKSICNQYIVPDAGGTGTRYSPEYCPQECIPKNYTTCKNNDFNFADSSAEVLTPIVLASCNPDGEEKDCYVNLPAPCPSPDTKPCVTYANFETIPPYQTEIIATATSGSRGLSQAKCLACKDALKVEARKISLAKTTTTLKQCYDIEDYEGTLNNLHSKLKQLHGYTPPAGTLALKEKLAYRLLEDRVAPGAGSSYDYSSLAGVKKIKTFDGTYGNFYPFKYSKDNLNTFPVYQLKDSVSAIKDGYIKFIILPDVKVNPSVGDATDEDKYFFSKTAPTPAITSTLKINLKSVSDFSNGEQLAVNVCKESTVDGTSCQGDYTGSTPTWGPVTEANQPLVNYFQSTAPPHKIIQYLSANTPKYIRDNDNKYEFNSLGQIIRKSDVISSLLDCNGSGIAPYVGANFLCFRDPTYEDSDTTQDGKYRLNFKIIDNEAPNCKGDGASAVNCDLSTDSACNKFKIINSGWDPSKTSEPYGVQPSINGSGIINILTWKNPRFFCLDNRYLNNSGHYDVSVKIKRDAKVKVSNFIDSLISPIMREIDGDNQATTLSYSLSPAVENQILNQDFYKEEYISFSPLNGFYHDYVYDAINIVYPYFDSNPSPSNFSPALKNPDIDITTLKTMAGGDPSIVGKKLKITNVPPNGTTSLTLDPKTDDRGNCGSSSSCFIKYINVAVVANIDEELTTPTAVTFKKHCFVRSNRFDTWQQVKMQCANKASCTINFDANTFPLRVFSIKETNFAFKYKDASAKISTQPYGAGYELKVAGGQISIPPAPGISLIDLENNLDTDFASCQQKTLIVEYIYSKSENPVIKENQVKRIYKKILLNPVYKSFLTLSVVLMFSFYGLGFLMGVSELKQSEIIDRLIKVGIIYLFTNPDIGWVWFEKFFVTFFKNGTEFLTFLMASIFDDTNRIDAMLQANNFSDKSAIFGSVDKVVDMFLVNDVVHKKITALLFYKFFGIIYMMIIYYSAIAYVYAVSNAVLLYLTSQFFTSVLFLVGPFFFVFILFKQTKTFFDNWINSLIGFSLQQIFLVFTLTLFNTFLYLIIKLNLGYTVCWDNVWQVPIGKQMITLFSFWTPQDSPSIINSSVEVNMIGASMPSLPKVLSLWTVCILMRTFISSITDLVATLSGGMSATTLGSTLSSGVTKIIESKKQGLGELYKKSGLNLAARADRKLFDSGQLAKNDRKQALAKDKDEQKVKEKMLSKGNKAVSKYKVENAEKFAKMNEQEKRAALTDVKQNAMRKAAKDMGKTSGQIDKLMNDKSGVKYQGDNVFGLLKSVATNKMKDTNSSLSEKSLKVDTGMSKKEMGKAIKNTQDPEKRKELINDIKEGKINKSEKGMIPDIVKRATPIIASERSNVSFKERSDAIKELEKSGQISKQNNMFEQSERDSGLGSKMNKFVDVARQSASGALGMTKRTAKEEEKIIAKVQENRNSQAIEKGPNMSAKEINKLNSFEKRLEQKEAKLSPEDRLAEKEKNLEKRSPDKQKEDRKDDSKRLGGNIEKLKIENKKNDIDKGKASAGVKDSQAKLDDFNRKMSSQHKEMDKLNKNIQSGSATNDDIKKFVSLKKEDDTKVGTGQDFKSKMQERGNLEKDLSEKTNVKNNIEKRGKNIDKAIDKNRNEKDKVDGNLKSYDRAIINPNPTPPAQEGAPAGGGGAGGTPAPAGGGGAGGTPAPADPAPASK